MSEEKKGCSFMCFFKKFFKKVDEKMADKSKGCSCCSKPDENSQNEEDNDKCCK